MKKLLSILLSLGLFISALTACGKPPVIGGEGASDQVTILTTGWINLPTDADDPYKKYILDKYDLDVTLRASSTFADDVMNAFVGSSTPPAIISFSDMTSFRRSLDQGVLMTDWTPWLEYMPNVKALVEKPDDGDPVGTPSLTRKMLTDGDELNAIWTIANPPTWSLKIREDWANEYRKETVGGVSKKGVSYPAGATATDGGPWQPNTPEDLLNFARWISAKKPDSYGFSSAGSGKDFGVLGTWIPLMFGSVDVVPWGIYIDEDNQANFGVQDGTHRKFLDYVKTLVDEDLIEPNWFLQNYADRTRTKKGQIGIEWMPGSIETDCYSYNHSNGLNNDTSNWWKTYDVPQEPGSKRGGYMPSDSFFGKLITVSARTANDTEKMKKICRLLNDVVMTMDESKTGADRYVRSETYEALRWGIGIEEGVELVPMEGTDLKYITFYQPEDTPESEKYYRSRQTGAWDWGAWFSVNSDGIIQGTTAEYTEIDLKVAEHDAITAGYERLIQVGGAIKLDTVKVNKLIELHNKTEYNYVSGKTGGLSLDDYYADFKYKWEITNGGLDLLDSATKEFKRFGLIK